MDQTTACYVNGVTCSDKSTENCDSSLHSPQLYRVFSIIQLIVLVVWPAALWFWFILRLSLHYFLGPKWLKDKVSKYFVNTVKY